MGLIAAAGGRERPPRPRRRVTGRHDVVRVGAVTEKSVADGTVLAAGRDRDRGSHTDDRREFATATDHVGVLVAVETTRPRARRQAVHRIERRHSTLEVVVEFLADWT